MDLWEEVLQRLHRRAVATAPRPYRVCLVLTFLCPFYVERILRQQLLALSYEVIEEVRGFLRTEFSLMGVLRLVIVLLGFHQQRLPRFIGVVVRTDANNMLVATFDDEQMAVLDAGDKSHTVVAKMFVEVFNELCSFSSAEMSSMVVLYLSICNGYDVAPYREVVGPHLITNGCRLKRSASFIDLIKVIAQNGGVGNFRAWCEAIGDGDEASCASALGEHVHIWCIGKLHRSFSSEPLNGMVGHTIT